MPKSKKAIALRFRICLHSCSESDIQTQLPVAFIPEERIYVNINNGIDEIKEIEKTTEVTDPFDEELEDNMIINDTYFLASRDAVTLDGMQFSFMKPPYMNFEDHIQVKRKLKKTFTQQEILLIYGYSGVGKTTVLTQFQEKYPHCIYLIKDFTLLSPSNMIVKMGECIGLPLKQRSSEILVLQERLRAMTRVLSTSWDISERSI